MNNKETNPELEEWKKRAAKEKKEYLEYWERLRKEIRAKDNPLKAEKREEKKEITSNNKNFIKYRKKRIELHKNFIKQVDSSLIEVTKRIKTFDKKDLNNLYKFEKDLI